MNVNYKITGAEMNTKLTLTIDDEVIRRAKRYSKEEGRSLSDLVENYLKMLVSDRKKENETLLSDRVQRLRGILKLQDDFDRKDDFGNHLEEINL